MTTINVEDALDQIEAYAASPAGLAELYSTMEFTDLCVKRFALSETDLTAAQADQLAAADAKLKSAFDTETLALYADYFPSFPIREWWG